jgi:hypothetical protein
VAGWGNQPHFASVVAGSVAKVADETSNHPDSDRTDPSVTAGDPDRRPEDQSDVDRPDTQLDDAREVLEDARRRLSEVPADVVICNHVMGLYELAAIHLGAQPPDLTQAALAIDAVGCLVEGLGERLGPDAGTLRDALSNIRIAFVQIKGAAAN